MTTTTQYSTRLRYGIVCIALLVLTGITALTQAREKPDGPETTTEESPDPATVPADIDTAGGPTRPVHQLHSTLLEVMKNTDELGYQNRYDRLKPVITSLFDTPLIAKVILSRYWDDLNDEQKSRFINLFNKLSTATYASRFDDYNGEEFHEVAVEDLHKGRKLVKTELQRRNKKPVKLDYLVHENNGEWQIISVIANGVNDLSMKRAEYAVVIRDKGYNGLLEDIQSKIKNLNAET